MRYLAIDLGDKRTGVALGDDLTGIVSPHEVINTSSEVERFNRLKALIEWEGPGALVVGWPLNMDGSVGHDELITTIGVEDLIIIRAGKSTLVCNAEDAERIKQLHQQVGEAHGEDYL